MWRSKSGEKSKCLRNKQIETDIGPRLWCNWFQFNLRRGRERQAFLRGKKNLVPTGEEKASAKSEEQMKSGHSSFSFKIQSGYSDDNEVVEN